MDPLRMMELGVDGTFTLIESILYTLQYILVIYETGKKL
jgi:hypothetical protein